MFFNIDLPVVGCVVAFIVGLLIIFTQRWHGRWTLDEHKGVQKFHHQPTPRIGGLSVVVSFFISVWFLDVDVKSLMLPFLMGSLVPFYSGFKEDVTKRVSVRNRLLGAMAGSLVASYLSGQYLNRLDILGVDWFMLWWPIGVVVTVLAISGVTNAINILDGFNGLASGVAIVILIFLGLIAYQANDLVLMRACLMLASSVFGFMLLNYPFGKIFLGDAGAYFIGFMVAWLGLLLSMRNDDISPWASLLVCAYPVVEVIYSMVRRMLARMNAGHPDDLHLHTLIKTRLVRHYFGFFPNWARNAIVAPAIWFCSAVLGWVASYYVNDVPMLIGFFVLFVIWYHATYRFLSRLPVLDSDRS